MLSTEERFVKPKVYFLGFPVMNDDGVKQFLHDSGNNAFWEDIQAARGNGLSDAEILCSLFSKLCYRSLTVGHNSNIERVREIEKNIRSTHEQAHGSVFEHVWFNFVIDDCSRVFTHELCRHRVGTAFSQTSGRYCRIEDLKIVWDPILDPVKELWAKGLADIENLVYLTECKLGLRKPSEKAPSAAAEDCFGKPPQSGGRLVGTAGTPADAEKRWVPDNSFNFDERKRITSAIRRIAPNGQENEMGFSVNLRQLRHTVLMRTASFSEWEIRAVFADIYHMMKAKFPTMFHGAKEREVRGITEVYGMRLQPYEKSAEMVLSEMTDEEALHFIRTRPKVVEQLTAV
jgi:thymidylate synthase (FAD)